MNVEKQMLNLIQEINFIFLSMNATVYVQSKCTPQGRHVYFARDPLRSYFHDPQKK